jgi:hypothetical protein
MEVVNNRLNTRQDILLTAFLDFMFICTFSSSGFKFSNVHSTDFIIIFYWLLVIEGADMSFDIHTADGIDIINIGQHPLVIQERCDAGIHIGD